MKRLGFITGAAGAFAASCAPSGPVQRYDAIDESLEPLRSRFNSAKQKVRVLMLVSPT